MTLRLQRPEIGHDVSSLEILGEIWIVDNGSREKSWSRDEWAWGLSQLWLLKCHDFQQKDFSRHDPNLLLFQSNLRNNIIFTQPQNILSFVDDAAKNILIR